MRFFITGILGQLGATIMRMLPAGTSSGNDLPDFDITGIEQVRKAIGAAEPDVVIHCAAFTDVDGCACDPEKAQLVNATGTRNVATVCAEHGAAMVLLSTNEVFDGRSAAPYIETDEPAPINPYGQSKLLAEWHTRELLERYYIVRTSWIYSEGGSNFIHKIMQLADRGEPFAIVTDEFGVPTYASDLARAILELVEIAPYGIYHLVNSGHTSRFGLARTVLDLSGHRSVQIRPILLKDYERASLPPRNGVLQNRAASELGISLRPWEAALQEFLSEF
jgi:dTDP-4-dehydrorhamnose reductase